MISVIIPTLNEQTTISDVVHLVQNAAEVSEILIIDDKSLDDTIKNAKSEKTKIYTSTKLGKGASMRDGMLLANNEIIVFLDADIATYPGNIIKILTEPIINDKADFVKSVFDRQAGRVTELVAKPLISLLFPELAHFSQPLSGMIAGKKSLFERLSFENDYGVDIGLLIDMHQIKARISEVHIGYIENRMQSLEQLGKMSVEVSRAILKRAESIKQSNLEVLEDISIIRDQMDFAIKESLLGLKKMLIFDMDNTILRNSFITTLATTYKFQDKLISVVTENSNPYTRTKLVAKLLKGLNIKQLLETLDSIPITNDFENTVQIFKSYGYLCGIISDSYDCITNHIVNKFGLDFSIANELEFSNSIASGEVKIPSVFIKTKESNCNHDFCKSNAMREIAKRYKIDIKNIIAIGDSESDICMIKDCGIGIAFCSTNETLNLVADKIISERSFTSLVEFIQ
ncbi:MAG: HAD-IB family phosphatase [Bacteroidales bacterium]|jgi:phosphoserine phosphatase SerB|nr:HAD-IB family phosphatase [Bacteroidales bacterium]